MAACACKEDVGYIALGANLGDRIGAMRASVRCLDARSDIAVRRASPVYEAEAHTADPGAVQPPYLNAVIEIRTRLAAEEVLAICQALEVAAGRKRRVRWMSRTLDLDLLTLGTQVSLGPELVLPHPRLKERRFVLQPWNDIAPNLYVPQPFDASVGMLLHRCSDTHRLVHTPLTLREPRM